MSILFDVQALTGWQLAYLNADVGNMQLLLGLWNDLIQNVVQRIQQSQIPLIVLKKETPKAAVCQVFEKVNTGGVALNVFELTGGEWRVTSRKQRRELLQDEHLCAV